MMRTTTALVWGILATSTMTAGSWAGELTVATVSPPRNGINVAISAPITITFDRPVLRESFTTANFWAFARWSGAAEGTISFSNNDQTVTLTPTNHFSHGEQVTVYLSKFVLAADGSLFRPAGYSWQFTTRVR